MKFTYKIIGYLRYLPLAATLLIVVLQHFDILMDSLIITFLPTLIYVILYFIGELITYIQMRKMVGLARRLRETDPQQYQEFLEYCKSMGITITFEDDLNKEDFNNKKGDD